MSKEKLRNRMLLALRSQSPGRRLAKSKVIEKRLIRLASYRKAKNLMCYAAFGGEVETLPILEQALADGKKVTVPVISPKSKHLVAGEIKKAAELKNKGAFGIPRPKRVRPISPEKLDLILVPGVAFDKKGGRLGRGGGYFDRFLESLPTRIPRVGLAFRFQVVKRLLVESHDQPVDRVITD